MGAAAAYALAAGVNLLAPSVLKWLGLGGGTKLPPAPDLVTPVMGRYRIAREQEEMDARNRLNQMSHLLGPGFQGSGATSMMTDVYRNTGQRMNQLALGFEDQRRSAANQQAMLRYNRDMTQAQLDAGALQNRTQAIADLSAGYLSYKYPIGRTQDPTTPPVDPPPTGGGGSANYGTIGPPTLEDSPFSRASSPFDTPPAAGVEGGAQGDFGTVGAPTFGDSPYSNLDDTSDAFDRLYTNPRRRNNLLGLNSYAVT